MRKLFMLFENLWVAAAFAEAGVYINEPAKPVRPDCLESAHLHAA